LAANGPYHLGERFSLVDIYMVMLVTWFLPMEKLLETFPAIKACYGIVRQRPAIESCLARQKHIGVGKP
jgi:glutathione S-transferase